MKKASFILSILAFAGVAALTVINFTSKAPKSSTQEGECIECTAGAIVYVNLDRILAEYDMANELRSVVETKVQSIQQEVTRRGNKLQKDVNTFQEKIDKGLLTRSVAEVQGQKLQEQQNEFQNYAAQKQQEIAEEEAVMTNKIADAIKTYIDKYNEEKGYAMILSCQGDLLPLPVVTAEASLDITDDVIAGLNEAYVKSKEN